MELVVVSPMVRATQTAIGAFAHLIDENEQVSSLSSRRFCWVLASYFLRYLSGSVVCACLSMPCVVSLLHPRACVCLLPGLPGYRRRSAHRFHSSPTKVLASLAACTPATSVGGSLT
eukprot:COSAG06_NODE_1301_length_9938_cov_49.846834_7_plen_117_part_00